MSHVVVVFSFPEQKDSVELGHIIVEAKKYFTDIPDVQIHMAINDVADTIISVFDPLHKEEGNLVKHAKRELEIINSDDKEFDKAIIAAVRGFSTYGHSGGSAAVGISMIHDLLQFYNLSPLTDNPKEWMKVEDNHLPGMVGSWQNVRNPEAFSSDGGKTYYLLSEGGNQNNQAPVHFSAQYLPTPIKITPKYIKD